MKRFIKNIAMDAFVIWPLIYFGLFMQMEYVYNVALALLWFISVGGIIGSMGQLVSEEMTRKAVERHKPQLWIHRKYQIITSTAEIAAMFAFGYFWLGGFYLVATLFIWSAKSKIEEEAK
ncbi:MAG: hypothetical protein E7L15_17545 [Citrobacter portucalensis]|nr:hypothetical protein [Citrobacter portucalensis]